MILTLLWIAATACLVWDVRRIARRGRRALQRNRPAPPVPPVGAPTPRTTLAVSRLYMGDMLAYQTTSHDSGERVRVRKGADASIVQVLS
jgi:hypothetical protein